MPDKKASCFDNSTLRDRLGYVHTTEAVMRALKSLRAQRQQAAELPLGHPNRETLLKGLDAAILAREAALSLLQITGEKEA